jgi:hypothetical protein
VFTVYILFVHMVGLVLAIAGIVRSGDRPQVLLYAFILEYGLRLATIFAITHALQTDDTSVLSRIALYLCRPPSAGQTSSGLKYEGTGRPVGASGYAVVVTFLAFLVFVLSNVNADRELDVDATTFVRDLRWAAGLASFYWMQSLLARRSVIDPSASREVNLGYNTRELTILAFATLAAGLVVAIRQTQGLPASGWTVLGPLMGFRFLYDVSAGLQFSRRQSTCGHAGTYAR